MKDEGYKVSINREGIRGLYGEVQARLHPEDFRRFRDILEDYGSGRWTNTRQLERMEDRLADLYPPMLTSFPWLYEDTFGGGYRQIRSKLLGSRKLASNLTIPQRVLIAINSCHKYQYRREAQRLTWLPLLSGAAYKYFIGNPCPSLPEPDAIYLDIPDTYEALTLKTRGAIEYALDEDFDYLFKTDDDCYIMPDRLLTSGFETADYVGYNGWRESLNYVFGGGYWLSRAAMEIIASEPLPPKYDGVEDRYIGNVLHKHGITARHDKRYVYQASLPKDLRDIISYTAQRDVMTEKFMFTVHKAFQDATTS